MRVRNDPLMKFISENVRTEVAVAIAKRGAKLFEFPYKMRGNTCPTCHAATESIDGGSLRAAREVKGIGLRVFARRIGRSSSYLSDVENNRRLVTPSILYLYQRGLA